MVPNQITSCDLYRYVDYVDYKRRRRCRNYIDFRIKITFLYTKDMRYIEDVIFHNNYDYRAVNRHQDFILLMRHLGARIIFFNTTLEGNIELGDLVMRRPNAGRSMISMKTTVFSLVERQGSFYIVSHHTHRRPEQFKVLRRLIHKPYPIDLINYKPACARKNCRGHNTNVFPCTRIRCACNKKGSQVYCYDCEQLSHLCHLGCGYTYVDIASHRETHSGTGDCIRNLYTGQKPIDNARQYLFIDLKKY
jgi:hypothetical protein